MRACLRGRRCVCRVPSRGYLLLASDHNSMLTSLHLKKDIFVEFWRERAFPPRRSYRRSPYPMRVQIYSGILRSPTVQQQQTVSFSFAVTHLQGQKLLHNNIEGGRHCVRVCGAKLFLGTTAPSPFALHCSRRALGRQFGRGGLWACQCVSATRAPFIGPFGARAACGCLLTRARTVPCIHYANPYDCGVEKRAACRVESGQFAHNVVCVFYLLADGPMLQLSALPHILHFIAK